VTTVGCCWAGVTRYAAKGTLVADIGMTPFPTRALAALWHALDRPLEGMEYAHEIEIANDEFAAN
jgi:hypothetical protein